MSALVPFLVLLSTLRPAHREQGVRCAREGANSWVGTPRTLLRQQQRAGLGVALLRRKVQGIHVVLRVRARLRS